MRVTEAFTIAMIAYPLPRLLAVVGLLVSVTAFAPTKQISIPLKQTPAFSKSAVQVSVFDCSTDLTGKGKLTSTFEPTNVKPMYQVFPGIGLPGGEVEPPRINNTFTNAQVDRFGDEARAFFAPGVGVIGKRKADKDSLKIAQDLTIKLNKLSVESPDSKNYKFFGNGDFAKSLILLLKSNPFMAPALTELPDGKGYELKTYDPEVPPSTLYRQILGTLDGVGHRVNIQFDSKMKKITGYQMYDDVTGNQLPQCHIEDAGGIQMVASSALYNVFFFASCIHATIHVLHYIYTAAFQVASKDFEEMNQWANDYAKNIPHKYKQVGELLLTEPTNALALVSGGSGLGSSQAVRYILKAVLQEWGKRPSAEGFYFDNMMNIPKEKLVKDQVILKEFMKHYNLVAPFAKDASAALENIDCNKFAAAEKEVGKYLKRCGEFTSNLSTLDEWMQVMAVTGAMHGGTLSYTRLMAMPEILRWRNYASPTWDFPDAFLLLGALGTVVGVEDERHVMTDSEGPYAAPLQKVLEDYNKETTKLKQHYQVKITAREDFNDYGWIRTDYCLDEFDGKQLTIATYV